MHGRRLPGKAAAGFLRLAAEVWQSVGHGADEQVGVDRLGDVTRAAGRYALVLIALHGVRRQGDDRHGQPAVAQQGGRGVAVHHRHLHVHEDQVERFLQGEVRAEASIFGLGDHGAGPLQQEADEFPVRIAVFHYQDSRAGQRGQGAARLPLGTADAVRGRGVEQLDALQGTGGDRDREGAPLADLAGDLDPSAQRRAMRRLIVSPKPVPPNCRVTEASA